MNAVIWHNPRCSKSRQTLALIEEAGVTPSIRLYLEDAPNADEVRQALSLLGFDDPRKLMRTKEAVYKELGLADKDADALIEAMAAHPKLIERPLLMVEGVGARLGRPPEQVLELLR